MHLTLHRRSSDGDSTIGQILIGTVPECWTVEDEYRAYKVQHETRIPAGTYQIKLRNFGGFHERFLRKFGPEFHKGMLWLQDVPGFEYILIHTGNTDDDTSGCIVVGKSAVVNKNGGGRVVESVTAYMKLYPKVREALLAKQPVSITITDEP